MCLIKYEGLSTKEKIIMYFLLYAFIGWCLETIYAFMVFGTFVKRGFLYGPICPIYGFGAILLICNLKKIKNNNIVKFFAAMILFTVFEYVASLILELLFNQRWWDYSNEFMNFQGRICLSFSILWGIFGVLFINYIHPFIENITNKVLKNIPIKIQRISIYIFVLIFFIDEIFSVLRVI